MASSSDDCVCLGLFSLKKKIEDAILRAETLAPTALDLEEERWIKQEAMLRDYNLWDDPVKSNEVLVKLAGITKAVDSLKDLKYKVASKFIDFLCKSSRKRICILLRKSLSSRLLRLLLCYRVELLENRVCYLFDLFIFLIQRILLS